MWKNEDEEESDYEEGDSEVFEKSFTPSYVVIAIDTHSSMFKANKEGKLHFRSCLEACYALADSLIFKSDKRTWSPFSIVLAGEQTALINFQHNILDSVKLLKAKTQLKDDEIVKEFQRQKELDLGTFFLSCKKLFHEIKTTYYKRTLIYITNDDNPVNNKNTKFTALNEAKNFGGNQIEFEVVPTVENFNYKLFYNELFSLIGGPRVEEICIDTDGLLQKLSASVVMKNNKHLNFYPFKDDPTRFIKCLKEEYMFSSSHNNIMVTKDGKKVINHTVEFDDNTSYRFRIKDCDRADSAQFTLSEKEACLDYSLPKGITLLYVSDRVVDVGHVLTKSFLLKEDPKEDLPYFKKFWQSCVDMNKVLVCMLKLSQGGKVRYDELIPVKVDGSPMFLVKGLPFANEISYPLKQEYPERVADEKQRISIQNLVDKMTFDFDLKMVPDVLFQKRRAYVKSKLLDEPIEEVNDVAFDRDTLDSHLREVVEEIHSTFSLSGEKKRKAPAQKGPSQKRRK
ncbi:ATP-dependent DNA helicase 2 subunit 1 [Leptinotarsa decemlineata]|uniref:ATP-dependent DNA helicase 2 subunit 1 n=1 Tax=Leptinotarsa decemlineata TaxID=7539 RepID=UPI003D30719C